MRVLLVSVLLNFVITRPLHICLHDIYCSDAIIAEVCQQNLNLPDYAVSVLKRLEYANSVVFHAPSLCFQQFVMIATIYVNDRNSLGVYFPIM